MIKSIKNNSKLLKTVKLFILLLLIISSLFLYFYFRNPKTIVESYIENVYNKNTSLAYINIEKECRDLYKYEDYSKYIDSLENDTLIKIIEVNQIIDESQDIFKRFEAKLIIQNKSTDTVYKYYTIKHKNNTARICELIDLPRKYYNLENKQIGLNKTMLLKSKDIYNTLINLALVFLRTENDKVYYDNSLKYSPKDARGYIAKAYSLLEQGKYDLAIHNYLNSLKLLKNNDKYLLTHIYKNIAICYYNNEKLDSALKYNSMTIKLDSTDSFSWYQSSLLINDNNQKINYLEKAFILDNDDQYRIRIYIDFANALYVKYKEEPKHIEYLTTSKKAVLMALNIELENEEANDLLIKINQLLK